MLRSTCDSAAKLIDRVELVLGQERVHLVGIRDVGLEEFVAVAELLRHPLEIGEIPGVGEDVDITDGGGVVMLQDVSDKVAPDEAAAACNQESHPCAY